MSKFEAWFKAQFGALPMSPEERRRLESQAEDLRAQAEHIEQRVRADDALSSQWTAALYAKQAAVSDFSF